MNPTLNSENLTKVYGNVPNQTHALNGITFQVMPGEFLGIMGSSGSGKSTLLNCIATVIRPTGGRIEMEGKNLRDLKEKDLADYRGKTVGYLFQNFELLDNLTARENILLPTSLHGISEKESALRLAQAPRGGKSPDPASENDSCRRADRCVGFKERQKSDGETVGPES